MRLRARVVRSTNVLPMVYLVRIYHEAQSRTRKHAKVRAMNCLMMGSESRLAINSIRNIRVCLCPWMTLEDANPLQRHKSWHFSSSSAIVLESCHLGWLQQVQFHVHSFRTASVSLNSFIINEQFDRIQLKTIYKVLFKLFYVSITHHGIIIFELLLQFFLYPPNFDSRIGQCCAVNQCWLNS
jgi:hypothetical protein